MYRKNTASQFFCFQGVDASTGGIKSGVTWTVRRSIDGTFAAAGGTATEDGTTGWYKFAMTQADTNGDDISFNFTGTGAVPQTINIVTTAADPTNATTFGLVNLDAAITTRTKPADTQARVTLVDTLTTYTGNTVQTGDVYPKVDTEVATLVTGVADIQTRLPAALTAGGKIKASMDEILAGGQSATDLKDFADTGYDPATHKVAEVLLTDTLTTYTGNTVQTGDSFARIGLAGAGLTNIDLPNQTMDITGNITGNLSGSVGSVTGAVGSVTGNVGGNVTGSVGSVVGIRIKKNTALAKFSFLMVLTSDHLTPATGKTIAVAVSLDGGAFGAATNTPATEIGNGVYYIDLAAGDLNGNVVVLKMTEAACDQNTVVIVTEP